MYQGNTLGLSLFLPWFAVNGVLRLENVTKLPETPAEMCSSVDAMIYYGKTTCDLIQVKEDFIKLPEDEKCRYILEVEAQNFNFEKCNCFNEYNFYHFICKCYLFRHFTVLSLLK